MIRFYTRRRSDKMAKLTGVVNREQKLGQEWKNGDDNGKIRSLTRKPMRRNSKKEIKWPLKDTNFSRS